MSQGLKRRRTDPAPRRRSSGREVRCSGDDENQTRDHANTTSYLNSTRSQHRATNYGTPVPKQALVEDPCATLQHVSSPATATPEGRASATHTIGGIRFSDSEDSDDSDYEDDSEEEPHHRISIAKKPEPHPAPWMSATPFNPSQPQYYNRRAVPLKDLILFAGNDKRGRRVAVAVTEISKREVLVNATYKSGSHDEHVTYHRPRSTYGAVRMLMLRCQPK